jgi:predicted RecA/RadA family phage recombinase
MAKTFVKSGAVVTAIATVAVVSGEPVLMGALFGIPMTSAEVGEEFELAVGGIYEIAKTSANTPTQFAKTYWNDTAKEVTTTASGNTYVGVFAHAYANGDTVAEVRLNNWLVDFNPSIPLTLPIEMNEYMQVAIVGASIMEQAVNTSTNRAVINDQLVTAGFSSAVYDRATATQDSAAILATLQAGSLDRFLEVADKTAVMVHAGGNDVSASTPDATLDTNLRAIYQFIKDAGFTLIPTPISYRTAPTLDPSAPYNTNVVLPAITDLAPLWIPDNVPVFDMYKLTSDTPSYLIDGIPILKLRLTQITSNKFTLILVLSHLMSQVLLLM